MVAPPRPAFGPIQLDLTKLPTREPAPQAPESGAPPDVIEKSAPAPAEPAEPAAAETTDRVPEALEPEAPPARRVSRTAKYDSPPLPDRSLLPHDMAAHLGPPQAAPPKANGLLLRTSEFSRQLNEALRVAAQQLKTDRLIKSNGQVEIAIHYRDGKVWGPWVLRSSGISALDQVMLDGVARANFPPPPPGFEGRELVIPILGSFW